MRQTVSSSFPKLQDSKGRGTNLGRGRKIQFDRIKRDAQIGFARILGQLSPQEIDLDKQAAM
jgi:hypothetical protein